MSKQSKNTTKAITLCAMLAALSVVLLYVGAVIQVMDIAMAALASFAVILAVVEYGKSAPWAIYGVTSVLSLILLPSKAPAAFYALFFGFYPILKEKFEKRNKLVCWVLKEIVFNICFVLMMLATLFFFTTGENELINPITIAATVVLGEAVFVLYDIALTRLISFYVFNLRDRLRINKYR